MVAEIGYGLGLAGDAVAGSLIKALGLDQGEGHVPLQESVVGQEDFLLATLAQEPLDLVAAVGEGRGLGCGWGIYGSVRERYGVSGRRHTGFSYNLSPRTVTKAGAGWKIVATV